MNDEIPVNDAIFVQKLQTQNNAAGVEHSSLFTEDFLMDMHHEITSTRVFHYKAHVILNQHQLWGISKFNTVKETIVNNVLLLIEVRKIATAISSNPLKLV